MKNRLLLDVAIFLLVTGLAVLSPTLIGIVAPPMFHSGEVTYADGTTQHVSDIRTEKAPGKVVVKARLVQDPLTGALGALIGGVALIGLGIYAIRSEKATEVWFRRPTGRDLATAGLGLAGSLAALLIYAYVVVTLGISGTEMQPKPPRGGLALAAFFMAVVAAPFGEELFWRGRLWNTLSLKLSLPLMLIVNAGFFALSHQVAAVTVLLFVIGLILCWCRYRSQAMWAPMLTHAAYNGCFLLLAAQEAK